MSGDITSMRDDALTVVCVLGAGLIGVAFAILFARAGFRVRMWDAYSDALAL